MPWARKDQYTWDILWAGSSFLELSWSNFVHSRGTQRFNREENLVHFGLTWSCLILSNGCARNFVQGPTPHHTKSSGAADGRLAGNRGLRTLLHTALPCNFAIVCSLCPLQTGEKIRQWGFPLFFFCWGISPLRNSLKSGRPEIEKALSDKTMLLQKSSLW